MKQKPIPSQTSQRLHQHPTIDQQRPSLMTMAKVNAIEFSKFLILSFILWVVIMAVAFWMLPPKTTEWKSTGVTIGSINQNTKQEKHPKFQQDISLNLPVIA